MHRESSALRAGRTSRFALALGTKNHIKSFRRRAFPPAQSPEKKRRLGWGLSSVEVGEEPDSFSVCSSGACLARACGSESRSERIHAVARRTWCLTVSLPSTQQREEVAATQSFHLVLRLQGTAGATGVGVLSSRKGSDHTDYRSAAATS